MVAVPAARESCAARWGAMGDHGDRSERDMGGGDDSRREPKRSRGDRDRDRDRGRDRHDRKHSRSHKSSHKSHRRGVTASTRSCRRARFWRQKARSSRREQRQAKGARARLAQPQAQQARRGAPLA